MLVYYAYDVTIPTIISLVNQHVTTQHSCKVLAENYGRKVDNYTIRLVVEGVEESISKAVEELKTALSTYAKQVSVVRVEDTEFYSPVPYEEFISSN